MNLSVFILVLNDTEYPHLSSDITLNAIYGELVVTDIYLLKILWELEDWYEKIY